MRGDGFERGNYQLHVKRGQKCCYRCFRMDENKYFGLILSFYTRYEFTGTCNLQMHCARGEVI